MPFNALDLLDFCEKLKSDTGYSEILKVRLILINSYYSVFLICRDRFNAQRVWNDHKNNKPDETKSIHEVTYNLLVDENEGLAARLDRLFAYRICASYRLEDKVKKQGFTNKYGERSTFSIDLSQMETAETSIRHARVIFMQLFISARNFIADNKMDISGSGGAVRGNSRVIISGLTENGSSRSMEALAAGDGSFSITPEEFNNSQINAMKTTSLKVLQHKEGFSELPEILVSPDIVHP